jgi:hypothetical protein
MNFWKSSDMTKLITRNALTAGCLLGAALLSSAASAQTASFTSSYTGGSGATSSCGSTYSIMGKEPTTGTHPVLIWTVGTGQSYTDSMSTAVLNAAVARGFVAASVQYNSGTFGGGFILTNRARCIYQGSSANSALSKLCARPTADCNKGVVVAGLSQGSIMADLARNFDSRVRAAWGTGNGVKYSIYDLASVLANGSSRQLSNTRLRVINGIRDTYLAGTDGTRTQNGLLTGFACTSTATNCLQSGGHGWYIVTDSQVQDGQADHCYMTYGGCSGATGLDNNWVNGTDAWTLNANLNWLQTFTTP